MLSCPPWHSLKWLENVWMLVYDSMTMYDRYDFICNPTDLDFSGPVNWELGARVGQRMLKDWRNVSKSSPKIQAPFGN